MNKIIFLDHDGVLCMKREQGSRFLKIKRWNLENPDKVVVYVNKTDHVPIQIRFDDLNKDAVRVLNEILMESDADIVISSDWRLKCTLDEMQEFYRQMGVIKVPIGMTDLYSTEWESTGLTLQEQRSIEIERYIEKHKPDKWVALDDMDLSRLKNFVKCKPSEGLKKHGMKKKIIKFL